MNRSGRVLRAVLVGAALVSAVIVTRWTPPPEASTPAPQDQSSASSASVSPSSSTAPSSNASAPAEPWQKTARSFITRYNNTKAGRGAWLKRLRPVVSDDVYVGLGTVRLVNVPTGTVGTGEVLSHGEVGGTMRFPLRGGSIGGVDVTVSATDEGTLQVTRFVPFPAKGVS